MTLVARTKNYSSPTMIGDLLVTAKTDDSAFILPAIGWDITSFIPEGENKPIGLAQKLYILADNVSIAFTSNDIREVRDLLEDFRIFCSIGLNPDEILNKVKEYDYSGFTKSSYLMMILDNRSKEKDGTIVVNEISCGQDFSRRESDFFKDFRPGGSGTPDFESIVNEEMKFFSSFSDGDPRQGIVKNGSLISRLLVEERYFLRTLESGWGGGYELVFYNGRKLEKLNNVAFVLQTGNYESKGEVGIQLPVMVNHYHYQGDNLIITTVELHNLSWSIEGEFKIIKSTSLRVGCLSVPQLRRGEMEFASDYPIESFETCNIGMGFIIKTPVNSWYKPSFYSGTAAIKISYSHERKCIEIHMHNDIQNYINDMFQTAYSDYLPSSREEQEAF